MQYERKVSTHCWPCGLVGNCYLLLLFVFFTFTGRCFPLHLLCLNRDETPGSGLNLLLISKWILKYYYVTLWIIGLTRVSFLSLLTTELWSSSLLSSERKDKVELIFSTHLYISDVNIALFTRFVTALIIFQSSCSFPSCPVKISEYCESILFPPGTANFCILIKPQNAGFRNSTDSEGAGTQHKWGNCFLTATTNFTTCPQFSVALIFRLIWLLSGKYHCYY